MKTQYVIHSELGDHFKPTTIRNARRIVRNLREKLSPQGCHCVCDRVTRGHERLVIERLYRSYPSNYLNRLKA